MSSRDLFVGHCPTWIRILGPPLGKLRGASVPQVIGTSSFFRHSMPVRLGPFVLRHSSTKYLNTENRARHRIMTAQFTRNLASLRQAVSRNAPRFRALPFLNAVFHPQVPPAEPSLLNRYHPSSCFEINRNHHLRPLAGDNRQ
jgi:hypothetical protein